MKFKEGDLVIFNKKYIKDYGLFYSGYDTYELLIKKGNKPMKIKSIGRDSMGNICYDLNLPLSIWKCGTFTVNKEEILPANNTVKKLSG